MVADSESYPKLLRPASKELGQCFHNCVLNLLFYLRAEAESRSEKLITICNGLAELYKQNPADCSLPKDHIWWTR